MNQIEPYIVPAVSESSAIAPLKVHGLVVTSPRNVALNSISLYPNSEEYVQIKVEACGLCTWEQRVYRGIKQTYPFWGGHEVCGVVDAVHGSNTSSFKYGERVSVALMRRCSKCYYCRRGLNNHCVYVRPEPVGAVPQGPRGLSDLMLVPPYQVFRLSPATSAVEGALVEPTACVLRSIDKGKVALGSTAVVIGSGTMGLIHTALLNLMGCRVVVCGEYKEQALSAGADVVLPFTINKLEERIRDITGRHGADAVFCTREGGDGIKLAVRVVGRGGRVVLFQSIRGSDIASLNMNDLHYREIEVVGTISQTISDFHRAVDLVSSHIGLYSFLETRVISATQGSIAFEMALEPSVNRVFVSFN